MILTSFPIKIFQLIIVLSFWIINLHGSLEQRSFTIDFVNHSFLKDGKRFQYISGSIHYFRIPKMYWFDRLNKMKSAGLNAIQLYVPWNFHQPKADIFDFNEEKDLELFITMASSLDLLVIARIGPYICSEWAFGGLPPWLLSLNPHMIIRSTDSEYMLAVTNWFNVLLPKLKPLLYSNGGPIISVQLENEYGFYPVCDDVYMSALYNLARLHLGPDIILFTTDPPLGPILRCGSPDPRYLTTTDFGPTKMSVEEAFFPLEKFKPNQPWVNSEMYTGWIDEWGGKHHRSKQELIIDNLKSFFNRSKTVNINLYMFTGGTNFGLTNGRTSITSYDFDAPIDESGNLTPFYLKLRKTICEIFGIPIPILPSNIPKKIYPNVTMIKVSHLLCLPSEIVTCSKPMTMEQLNQYQGLIVYSTNVNTKQNQQTELKFDRFSDLLYIYTKDKNENFNFHEILDKSTLSTKIELQSNVTQLIFVVENTGYWNAFGKSQNDVKGIIGNVFMNNEIINDWQMKPIPTQFSNHSLFHNTECKAQLAQLPGEIYYGELVIHPNEIKTDTFIELNNFKRGIVSINQIILGRYDQLRGPQLRLYLPANFLKVGINKIVILELQEPENHNIYQVSFHKEMLWSK